MTEERNLYPLWLAEDYIEEPACEATMEDWEDAENVLVHVLGAYEDMRECDGVYLGNDALRLALWDAIERIDIEIKRMREQEKERTREVEPTEFGRFLFKHIEKTRGIDDLESLVQQAQTVGFVKVKEGPLRRAVYDDDALYEALTRGGWGPTLPYILHLSEEEAREMVGFVMDHVMGRLRK
jgi:hypothetical protein